MSSPASDDRSGRTGTIALVLAALSTLALLAAIVTAAVLALGDDDAAATDGSERPPEPSVPKPESAGGQIIYGDRRQNAQFEIPSLDIGWSVTSPGITLYDEGGPDADGDGRLDKRAEVRGTIGLYKEGLCTNDHGPQQPAFVGFSEPEKSDDAEAVNKDVADNWLDVLSYKEDNKTRHEATDVTTESVDLPDDVAGYLSQATVTIAEADREKCFPPKVEVNVLSFESGTGYVTSVVLCRDLEGEQELADDQVEEILGTVRRES